VQFGKCAKTSCANCQDCLVAMRDTQNISTYSEPAASRCTNQLNVVPILPNTCSAIKEKFFPGTLNGEVSKPWAVFDRNCEMASCCSSEDQVS
jgi:hypothetical protein